MKLLKLGMRPDAGLYIYNVGGLWFLGSSWCEVQDAITMGIDSEIPEMNLKAQFQYDFPELPVEEHGWLISGTPVGDDGRTTNI